MAPLITPTLYVLEDPSHISVSPVIVPAAEGRGIGPAAWLISYVFVPNLIVADRASFPGLGRQEISIV